MEKVKCLQEVEVYGRGRIVEIQEEIQEKINQGYTVEHMSYSCDEGLNKCVVIYRRDEE